MSALRVDSVELNLLTAVQEQQRQAERAHDNCRRDVEQQAAANEELSSELQVPSVRLRLGVVWCNACAAIAAAAEVDGISGGNAGA